MPMTGGSLTSVTVIDTAAGAESLAPSLVVNVTVSGPKKSGSGV